MEQAGELNKSEGSLHKESKHFSLLNFLWCFLGLFIGFGLITLLVWQLNLQTTKQRRKSDDYVIERIVNNTSEVANGALAIPDENIVLSVKSKSGKIISSDNIKWWYDTSTIDFNNINIEPADESTLQLKVVSDSVILNTSEITVLAIITEENGNEVTTSIDIQVGAFITNPVPENVFRFGETEAPGDTLMGFADGANWDSLKNFDSLDFSTFDDDVKYVGGDFAFPKELFDGWDLLEINFGNLTYLNNENGESGKGMFEDCDLHTVVKIDYSTSTWASEGTTSSASHTFDGADLSSLEELNLNDAKFAVPHMSDGQFDNAPICTADHTFANAILPSLTELNLSGTTFACSGMSNVVDIYTAHKTFYCTSLPNLMLLDLSESIFAETGMTTLGSVYTASQTFEVAEMSNVIEAYLKKEENQAVFGEAKMTVEGDVYTGNKTFAFADLSKIPEAGGSGAIVGDGIFEVEHELMSEVGDEIPMDDTYKDTLFGIVFKPVPITSEYFSFGWKDCEGTPVQAITGWNEDVLNGVKSLNAFNSLDFTWHNDNEPEHKYISGSCNFTGLSTEANIINSWKLLKIDFGDMIFLNDESGYTGHNLFGDSDTNFNSLLTIDFNCSIWATKGTSSSAHYVFYSAEFPNLLQIDMSHATFASEGMDGRGDCISTAKCTFGHCEMPNLRKLNLKGAVFATEGMTEDNYDVYTADCTFYNVSFDSLETLDLSTTIFAASNMTKDGEIYTANRTFVYIEAPNLSKLILSKGKKQVIFASPNMNSDGLGISTATGTFQEAELENLSESEIIGEGLYEAEGMILDDESTKVADLTFERVAFKAVIIPLPIEEFFEYDTESIGDNNSAKVITGMKTTGTDGTSFLEYNSLDFSILKEQWYVDGDFKFDPDVIKDWDLVKIDFGSLIFLNNTNGESGKDLFKGCNLQKVKTLNFNRSVWATPGTLYSACESFSGASFELNELIFTKTLFSCRDMDLGENTTICTAYKTFSDATLICLTDLNLKGAVFATSGMATGNTTIHTAASTFEGTNLNSTIDLELFYSVFAVGNMNQSGAIYTASKTFSDVTAWSLANLDFINHKRYVGFACSGMSVSGSIHTAYQTFKGSLFSDLDENSIIETVALLGNKNIFNAENMTGSVNVFIKDETYEGTIFLD